MIEHLHDPFLMKDMEQALERIETAINREKILIYGDYDVDGTTPWPLFTAFLKQLYLIWSTISPIVIRKVMAYQTQGIDYAAKTVSPYYSA
jgi:single-stranded-DNA-specific exonuclease